MPTLNILKRVSSILRTRKTQHWKMYHLQNSNRYVTMVKHWHYYLTTSP